MADTPPEEYSPLVTLEVNSLSDKPYFTLFTCPDTEISPDLDVVYRFPSLNLTVPLAVFT